MTTRVSITGCPFGVVVYGSTSAVTITGTDHPTRDGTGIRDYIHVWDLAQAHVAAVERFADVLAKVEAPSTVINLGTGDGVTVRELVTAFEKVFGKPVPIKEGPPRPGDAVGAFANVDKAREVLGWAASHTTEGAIESALAWSKRRRAVLGYD